MIKVLLVDDEEWIRLGIKAQIVWDALGIELVGEAANGVVALEMIERYKPEIIISDIRMPIMDGIQLMEAVHSQFPETIIIVVSGYSDFEYARKAISFQVFDYILKPIEEEKLEQTLLKAVQKLVEQSKKKSELLDLNIKLNENEFLAREKFLTQLIRGSELSLKEIQHNLAKYGYSFAWPRLSVVVLNAKNFEQIAADKYKNDADLASYVLFNVVQELFADFDNSIIFTNYSKPNELILIKGFDTEEPELIISEIYARCTKVIEEVSLNIKFELYAGIGRESMSIQEIASSYRQAMEALLNVGIIQGNRILTYDQANSRNEYYVYPDDKEKTLLYNLENSYKAQTFRMIEDFLAEINASQTIDLQSIRSTIWELTLNIRQALKKHNGLLEEVLQDQHIHDKIMKDLITIDELKDWLLEAASKAMDFIASKKKSGSKKIIIEIVAYLHKNYNGNVNLNTVADIFFLNPTYLSRIFKSETSYNFNEYLNKVRMDAAVKLLKRDDLKMSDISEMVGYGNVAYFFKRFKGFYGCTPTDYKAK